MERSGAIGHDTGHAGPYIAGRRATPRFRAPRPRRLAYLLALAVVLSVAGAEALQVGSWWGQFGAAFFGRRQGWDASDFACFYSVAKLVVHGDGPRILDQNALYAIQHTNTSIAPGHVLPYLNPPFLAGLMAPLGLLSFAGAYQTWSVLSIVVLWLCCWQMWQTTGAMPMPWRVVAILAFVTLYPLAYSLRQGQFSLWLVAGLGGAYNSLRAGRDRSAGVWLSLLLLKPELVVPIAAVLAWKRRCGVFTTLAPITAACVVASIAVVGPPEALRYPMYLRNISLQHATGTFTPEMFGWTGLVGAPLGAEHPKLALAIHIPLALATLGAVAVLWRGPWRADDGQFSSRWFALILATLLADPHLYLQDTILVVPAAIAWVSSERAAGRAGEFFVVLLGWTILGLGTSPNLNWHVNLFATLMALVTAMLVARGMWHSRTAGDSERTARDAVVLAALG